MAAAKHIGLVSNTYRGATNKRTGEFIHELDKDERWIPTNNVRVTLPVNDVAKTTVSASVMTSLAKQHSLNIVTGADYQLSKVVDLDATDDRPAVRWCFYKPIAEHDVSAFVT